MPKSKRQNQRDAKTFFSPALRVAVAKVPEEMVAAARAIVTRVVAVVAAEAGTPKAQLHLVKGRLSTIAMVFFFLSHDLRRNAIVALSPDTDTTSAPRQ